MDLIEEENKIEHITNVKAFIKKLLSLYKLEISENRIIPFSCKEDYNIFDNEEFCGEYSLTDSILKISQNIISYRDNNPLMKYLPSRMSILSINKITGTGIVVQGFVLSGEFEKEDKVIILPQMIECTIGSIQSYNKKVFGKNESCIFGFYLKKIAKQSLTKGNMIVKKNEFDFWKNQELSYSKIKTKETFLQFNLGKM